MGAATYEVELAVGECYEWVWSGCFGEAEDGVVILLRHDCGENKSDSGYLRARAEYLSKYNP